MTLFSTLPYPYTGHDMKQGHLFLILGPSGSGKGTVIAHLRKVFPDAIFPLSCTTRSPRPGEKDGEVYHFTTKDDFKRRIEASEFLEWAVVHNDNFYGTLKGPILEALDAGKMVIREVDIQGVRSIRGLLGRDRVTTIFITFPSWENLRHRILKRSELPEAELAHREESFKREMAFASECDHVVLSEEGKIPEVCNAVEALMRAKAML